MNVFEDLIEELKEENLLESTVIETNKSDSYYNTTQLQTNGNSISPASSLVSEISPSLDQSIENETFHSETFAQDFEQMEELNSVDSDEDENDAFEVPSESVALNKSNLDNTVFETEQLVENLKRETTPFSAQVLQEEAELQALNDLASKAEPTEENQTNSSQDQALEEELPEFPEYELLSKSVVENSEFYRRRANEEVTSLQIVEHILTAIEKEQMKIVPQSYDDLPVSMALHDFLQAGTDPLSNEHTQAEFKLMQETEKWYSALAVRDNSITVGDLRRYCETARPALSSQALISLARFYRNSPFSESVRSKFDMVMTRLVTKENWDDTRIMLFNREELNVQLGELYSDWSSIPLYENNEDDSDVLIGVLKFEDFLHEVNNAESLDELIKNDFFNRIKIFKESTNEKFFAPLLVSAAIECNVIVGNKYVQLVQQERSVRNEAEIEEKYNFLLDQPVSDTLSKTLKLIELLKEKKEPVKPVVPEQPKEIKETLSAEKSSHAINIENAKKKKHSQFRVNKLTIAFILLSVAGLGGLYTWSEYMTPPLNPSPSVKKVSLENSSLKEYFKTARISRDTFFAVTDPNWDKLSNDVKEDLLKKTLTEGIDRGYNKIHVLNSEGKTVAFASEKGITLESK